jgi:hypothetical protein
MLLFPLIQAENYEVRVGGEYSPAHCNARDQVAIIVPYRKRETQLPLFLSHMHKFLRYVPLQITFFSRTLQSTVWDWESRLLNFS